jgi:hypothetical protein
MAEPFRVGDIIRVPDERIGETVVDELFGMETASQYKRTHPIASRCDSFVARDPGDNLIVITNGEYQYWDHESDELIQLGSEPAEFVARDSV